MTTTPDTPQPRAAATTRHGWPLPEDTDRLSAGAAAMRALGDAIDQDVLAMTANVVTVPSSATFSSTANVTFPAGLFGGTPVIVATIAGNQTRRLVRIDALTNAGATINVHTADGTALATATTVYYIAMGRG